MISTLSPAPLKLDLRPSLVLRLGFALVSLCCLVALQTVSLAGFGVGAVLSQWLVVAVQGCLALYAGAVLRQLENSECSGQASLHFAGGDWWGQFGGVEHPLSVEFSCVSRYLLVLSIRAEGRHWRLPVVADQLDAERFRVLRRLALCRPR